MRSLRDRLADVGLRWRLAGWVTVVVLVCLGIAFVAVYRGTGTQVRHEIDTEIAGDASAFAHSLALANPRSAKTSRARRDALRSRPAVQLQLHVVLRAHPGRANEYQCPGAV